MHILKLPRPALLALSAVVLSLSGGCASVKEIQPVASPDPKLPGLRTLFSAASAGNAADDYKLRAGGRDTIRLVMHYDPAPAGYGANVQDIAYLKAGRLLRASDVQMIEPPLDMQSAVANPGPASLKYLAGVEADAVASVSLKRVDDNRATVELRLLDPVSGKAFGEYSQPVTMLKKFADPAHQTEFYKDRRDKRYEFLSDSAGSQVVFTGDARSVVRDLVLRSVTAEVSVQSSNPETVVTLISDGKRRSLGQVPVSGERLREGKHRVEVKRPGYEAIVRDVQIRAGRDQDLFITWPDDRDSTSLAILSAPAGQRVSIDGSVRGQTPLYLTSLEPGVYGLELSRSGEGGAYEITGETRIELNGGDNTGRIFFVNYTENFGPDLLGVGDFWRLTAEGDATVKYAPNGGLAFTSESSGGPYVGLTSLPMTVDASFDMRLSVKEGDGNFLAFGLKNDALESVFVRMDGNVYSLARYQGGEALPVKSFQTIKQRENNVHEIRYTYEKEENRFRVRVDGDVIYEGAVRRRPGRADRPVDPPGLRGRPRPGHAVENQERPRVVRGLRGTTESQRTPRLRMREFHSLLSSAMKVLLISSVTRW